MNACGEVTMERDGKTYGATYEVEHGMVVVKTHTETRSIELGDQSPEMVARRALSEIVNADRNR
ncbi:MAG TPA: hypothetical protein VNE58_09545 [Casimicrobiaceae bacterium]|nr:hypothetical protein [Casimicrobiaceae bacterium]